MTNRILPTRLISTLLVAVLLMLITVPQAFAAAPQGMTLTVLQPAEGAQVAGRVLLQVQVTSRNSISRVQWRFAGDSTVRDLRLQANGYWEATWNAAEWTAGTYKLHFEAWDSRGNYASAYRTVIIPPLNVTGEWLTPRGDLWNRAFRPEGPGTDLTVRWFQYRVFDAALVLQNGVLYGLDSLSTSRLQAVDAATGALKWEFDCVDRCYGLSVGPVAAYITDYNRAVYGVALDGTLLWSRPIAGSGSPTYTGAAVLVSDTAGTLHALDPATGATLWQAAASSGARVVVDGKLYVGQESRTLVLDLATGGLLATLPYGTYSRVVYDNGLLYLYNSAGVMAVDPVSGEARWTHPVGGQLQHMTAGGGLVLYNDMGGKLVALDGLAGSVRWTTLLSSFVGGWQGAPSIAGNVVYVAPYNDGVKLYDRNTGALLGHLLPGESVSGTVLPLGENLFVPTDSWGLYGLSHPVP